MDSAPEGTPTAASLSVVVPRRLRWRRIGLRRSPLALRCGTGLLVLIILACILVPAFSSTGPYQLAALPYQAPSAKYLFGTDDLGRDCLVRVFQAGRLDMAIAFISVGLSVGIGTLVGIIAGITRLVWLDRVLMRVVDMLLAFPFLVLLLVLIVILGPTRTLGPFPAGAAAVIVAWIAVDWTVYARLARAQTMSLRERDYMVATRVLGYSTLRRVLRHLLPGVLRIAIAYAAADAVLAMIATASVSFLGVGVQAPTPEWGGIMYEGRGVLATAWWISTIPGILLALTGLSLSLISDSLLGDSS